MMNLSALALLPFLASLPECPPVADANPRPVFDASLLKEGKFIYRTTRQGESLGETVIEIRRAGDHYRLAMTAPLIAQAWRATVKPSFAPITAQLSMAHGESPYSMSLRYEGTRIRGQERKGDIMNPVKARSTGLVIDQRVDWASVMAVDAPAGSAMTLSVYDPGTGFSQMLGKVGGTEVVKGAWGESTAVRLDYSICKGDHVENYTVYATQEFPRYMLREDMPNGLVSELLRIEP